MKSGSFAPACLRRSLFELLTLSLLLVSVPARAADPMAESLFQEARALMEHGRFEDACPKLAASHRLEPKSGTMTMLASCDEQIGKLATAWAEYKEAAAIARAEGRKEHIDKATELAAALEPRLSKLRLDAVTPPGGVELTVKLDGSVLPQGIFGVAFAIDPGKHTLEVMAKGMQAWSVGVEIKGQPGTTIVAIPELEATRPVEPPPLIAPPPPIAPRPAPAPPPPPEAPPKPAVAGGGVPRWAWIVGAGGLASLGVSLGFFVDQRMASSALDDHCGGAARDRCTPDYDFEGDHAREKRDFGMFLGFGVGGLGLLATSAIGIVTAGPSSASAPRATALPRGHRSSTTPRPAASRRVRITPRLGPGSAGASVELGF